MENVRALKNERALKKGNLTRTRRRACVLVDTVGSKRVLQSMMKELDDALDAVLEVNMKYSLLLEDDEKKKCHEYEKEVSDERKAALEKVEAHLKARAGEPPSDTSGSSRASRYSAQHTTRMAEVENEVKKLELEQLQQRLQNEEEEQRLHRERLLQEKSDAVKAASLKVEVTRAAESELAWDRKGDFTCEGQQEDVGEVKKSKKRMPPAAVAGPDASSHLFRKSLPRLKLPTFSGVAEEWPRWYSLF